MGTTIVGGRDGSESLLAGGVPDLQFDRLTIEFNGSDLEVHTNGGDVVLGVGVVGETQQQARLSDTGIADQQQLKQVIVFVIHGFSFGGAGGYKQKEDSFRGRMERQIQILRLGWSHELDIDVDGDAFSWMY